MTNKMKRTVTLFAVLVISAFFVSGTAEAADCSFIKDLKESPRYRCGRLEVPEDHGKPAGRKIEIAYVVIKAKQEASRPDPVIHFSGGPGGGSLNAGFIGFLGNSSLAENRDVIMFDQRGIQYSSALPDIGEGVFKAMAADTDMSGERKMIVKVLKKFAKKAEKEGIDLSTYNSIQNARDVGVLMKELGYKKYNLFGISYGTRLARLLQDMYPEMINAVILDSPNLMTDDFLIDRLRSYSAAAQKTFEACRRDEKCSKENPDLEGKYTEVIEKLKRSPLKVTFKNGDFIINAQDAMYFLRRQLYRTNALSLFPGFLRALDENNQETLRNAIVGELGDVTGGGFNTSMFLAVSAFESMDRDNDLKTIDGYYEGLPHFPAKLAFFTNLYIEGMDWHGKELPMEKRTFRQSAVPTLIMVNQYDPVTPPENGEFFKKKLDNSFLYIIDEGGHSGGDFPCKMKVMTAFMDSPGEKPDASCLKLFKQ